MSDREPVRVCVADDVMTVILNRPQVRNAMNHEASEAVGAAMQRLASDPALRVGVISGAGGTFCSGTDLVAHARGEKMRVVPGGFYGLIEQPPLKPLIAAVEGFAVGGGFEIALACDLIVASETARFGLPEVRHGVFAGAGGVLRLGRRIAYHQAMELALTGSLIDARRAAALGLIDRAVERGEALSRGQALAAELAGEPHRYAAFVKLLPQLRAHR